MEAYSKGETILRNEPVAEDRTLGNGLSVGDQKGGKEASKGHLKGENNRGKMQRSWYKSIRKSPRYQQGSSRP